MKKILILVVTIMLLAGCQRGNINIRDRIINTINTKSNSNTCDFSMKDITNFKWDRMVIFEVGSSNVEVSRALGIDYKDSTDLMSGIVFIYNNKIVYQERIPSNPEKPSKLNYVINNKPGEPNCVAYTLENCTLKGSKENIDGVMYYTVSPLNTK